MNADNPAATPEPPPNGGHGDVVLDLVSGIEALESALQAKGESPRMIEMFRHVRDDLAARREFGIAKYGTPLRYGNGRNYFNDAYQELLDALCYLRGAGANPVEALHLMALVAAVGAVSRGEAPPSDAL